jgi:adenylylsulfate kinase
MSEPKSKNITWHGAEVTQAQREEALGQKGAVVWLTGLSASGKSTIARRVEQKLLDAGVNVYVLDGDNLRMGLNKDLGFSPADRTENIRRVGCVAQLFADAGAVVLTAFISPYRTDRDKVREHVTPGRFVEVHVATSLEACEARDPKGLYKKAREGKIPEFTGISAPYEAPERPEITLDNSGQTIDESADALIRELNRLGFARR